MQTQIQYKCKKRW